jgi:hypothetical protein
MSKKRKRSSRASNIPKSRGASSSSSKSLREEFSPDYTYVIKDLRRIGTLAGSFFLILVVLSFILR